MYPLTLVFLRCLLEVSDYSFVLFKLQAEFLFFFVNPFIKIRYEMVEIILSPELCLTQHRRSQLVVVDASSFINCGASLPSFVQRWSISIKIQMYFLSPWRTDLQVAPLGGSYLFVLVFVMMSLLDFLG
jgi:hypothetical protein